MLHYLAGVRAIRTPDVGLVSASGEPFREMRRLFAGVGRGYIRREGRPATYSFGSRNPKRIISFLPTFRRS
jgi:hypothetical protein